MICTITPISNSKQVENYYTRDDYYSRDAKPNDFWQGKLSDRFDLNHQVIHKNHFTTLFNLPMNAQILGIKSRLWVLTLLFLVPNLFQFCKPFHPSIEKL